MASIDKRGNTYRIRVSCGLDINGKQIIEAMTYIPTHKEGTKTYEKEIADAARDFEKQVKEGKYLTGEKLTYKDVTDHWRTEWAKKKLSDGGEDYYKTIKYYAYPAFGNTKISKITPLHVQALLNDLEERGLKPGTIKRVLVAINSVFRYAYRLRIIQENPCLRCEAPKIVRDTALHYFTKEQAMTFLNKALTMEYTDKIRAHDRIDDTGKKYHVKEYQEVHTIPLQFRALYTLAIYGGFRRGELAALTWEDIDFYNNKVRINKAAALRKGGYIIKGTKTEAGIRTVTLPAPCFDLLRKWKSEEMKLRFSQGSAWEGAEDFEETNIFIQATGKMIDLDTIGQKFRTILDRYNATVEDESEKLPIIRLHDLRHTSATLLIGSGCDIETVSKRLGHSKASVTLDIYAHPIPENDIAASQMLDKMMVLEA